jgi:hypothetical protein
MSSGSGQILSRSIAYVLIVGQLVWNIHMLSYILELDAMMVLCTVTEVVNTLKVEDC